MPNWCYNILRVNGKVAAIREFQEFVVKRGIDLNPQSPPLFSFHMFLPMPKELEGTISPRPLTVQEIRDNAAKYGWDAETLNFRLENAAPDSIMETYQEYKRKFGYENWYDWCNGRWGVKWDAIEVDYKIGTRHRNICIRFNTAWGPPIGVLDHMAYQFPNLTFVNRYSVEGYSGYSYAIGNSDDGFYAHRAFLDRIAGVSV